MPPTGYLSAAGVEACVVYIANAYPSIAQSITLPETSVQGSTSRALKLASGGGANRDGVLLIGGVHARELINPDLLVSLALRICHSYSTNSDIVYGGKTWKDSVVKGLIDTLDIFIFPLVNPDGRSWVQNPSGYAMWRKNRRVNAGSSCMGVDLNRNYDFLWSSGIGTSASACSDTFKGPSAFAEPETRNVRWMLDTFTNIEGFIDVHSFSELILYPWGDDDNQTTDPSQNFQNPAWNGLRGVLGSGYGEYIDWTDQDRLIDTGRLMRDSIAAVRGRTYTVEQASDLYPTSGTSKDYAYSRHLVDTSKRKVYAYTLETATQFQPPYTEANEVIKEASSGLLQFLVSIMCVLEGTSAVTLSAGTTAAIRAFRDREIRSRGVGRRWLEAVESFKVELLELTESDDEMRRAAGSVIGGIAAAIEDIEDGKARAIDAQVLEETAALMDQLSGHGSRDLASTLEELRADLDPFRGKPILEVLSELEAAEVGKGESRKRRESKGEKEKTED